MNKYIHYLFVFLLLLTFFSCDGFEDGSNQAVQSHANNVLAGSQYHQALNSDLNLSLYMQEGKNVWNLQNNDVIHFGFVPVGEYKRIQVTLKNNGSAVNVIDAGVDSFGSIDNFTAYTPGKETLYSDYTYSFLLEYTPKSYVTFSSEGDLRWNSGRFSLTIQYEIEDGFYETVVVRIYLCGGGIPRYDSLYH